VLIVDGVFAFRPELDEHRDFRVWLEIDDDLSVRRGAARDQDWAGSDAEAVHRDRYLVAERIYLREVDPHRLVDMVIDNSVFERPRVIRG
jgi:uridine kinase